MTKVLGHEVSEESSFISLMNAQSGCPRDYVLYYSSINFKYLGFSYFKYKKE